MLILSGKNVVTLLRSKAYINRIELVLWPNLVAHDIICSKWFCAVTSVIDSPLMLYNSNLFNKITSILVSSVYIIIHTELCGYMFAIKDVCSIICISFKENRWVMVLCADISMVNRCVMYGRKQNCHLFAQCHDNQPFYNGEDGWYTIRVYFCLGTCHIPIQHNDMT